LNTLTDNAIMLKVKNGDLDKMGLLFERYHRSLFAFLYHMTNQREASEDMVQNVFYRMLRSRHTFRGDGEFRTWMYHVARNVLKDHGKKTGRSNHYDVTEFAEQLAGNLRADERIQKRQEMLMLQHAMANLSPENRELLVLNRLQELKYHEIARIMDMTADAVKLRIHRAIHQLRNRYAKIESNEM
jgi:RNA polymerase sigma-70 factor (ECF subfamily)